VRFRPLFALFCVILVTAANAADRPGKDGFLLALPGYELEFPRDHGSHDGYRTEWWYYTGHLRTDDGHRYGFEVTFFRVGVSTAPAAGNPWELRHLALAHFAITDIDAKQFRYYEKLNRSSPFTARAATGYLDVFNEGWRATTARDGAWRLVASEGSDALELTLRTRKAPAIHGANGVSVKAEGEGYASHYYSMTRLEVTGRVNGRACSGQAWMDHEFGSSALRENQRGWDWFSIQLDNDAELMLYVIRRSDGTPDVSSSGSLITSDGSVVAIRRDQMRIASHRRWKSKRSSATYPLDWTIVIPTLGINLDLKALVDNQELVTRASTGVTYWEGAVSTSGSFGNMAVSGEGYVEMTGYDRAFRAP
jgi:predicted secreted hydrolase